MTTEAPPKPRRRGAEPDPDPAENGHDGDAEAETEETGPPEGHLLDPARYDDPELAIPKVDGNQIDRIALQFSGTVYLDRSDPADVALYKKLALSGELTLQIEGKCSKTAAGFTTNKDGDLDVVVGTKTVKVETVYVPPIA